MDGLNVIGASADRSWPRHEPSTPSEALSPGCALVPVRPIDRSEPAPEPSRRPAASFLAHLIATSRGEPQTRERRRAEPGQAAQAYARTLAETPTAHTLSRAM